MNYFLIIPVFIATLSFGCHQHSNSLRDKEDCEYLIKGKLIDTTNVLFYVDLDDCFKCRIQINELKSYLDSEDIDVPIFLAVEGLKSKAVNVYIEKYHFSGFDSIIPAVNLLPKNGSMPVTPKVLLNKGNCVKDVIELSLPIKEVKAKLSDFLEKGSVTLPEGESLGLYDNVVFQKIHSVEIEKDFCALLDKKLNTIHILDLKGKSARELEISDNKIVEFQHIISEHFGFKFNENQNKKLSELGMSHIQFLSIERSKKNSIYIASDFAFIENLKNEENLSVVRYPVLIEFDFIKKQFNLIPIKTKSKSLTVDLWSSFGAEENKVVFRVIKNMDDNQYFGVFNLENGGFVLDTILTLFAPKELSWGFPIYGNSIELNNDNLLVGYNYYPYLVNYNLKTHKMEVTQIKTEFYGESNFTDIFTFNLINLDYKGGNAKGILWDKGTYIYFDFINGNQRSRIIPYEPVQSNKRYVNGFYENAIYTVDNQLEELQLFIYRIPDY